MAQKPRVMAGTLLSVSLVDMAVSHGCVATVEGQLSESRRRQVGGEVMVHARWSRPQLAPPPFRAAKGRVGEGLAFDCVEPSHARLGPCQESLC